MTKEQPYPFHRPPPPLVLVTMDTVSVMRDQVRQQIAEIRARVRAGECVTAELALRVAQLRKTERRLTNLIPEEELTA